MKIQVATEEGLTIGLTIKDAAKRLGVHYTTLYRWLNKGKVTVLVFPNRIIIPISEVERLEELVGK